MTNEQNTKDCPKEQELYNYTVGALICDEKAVIEKHLFNCDLCLKEVVHFKRSLRAMSQDENTPVPAELMEKVIKLVSERERTVSTKKRLPNT